MQDIILPPFAPILMESTRAIGYSLEAAIADIVDNCIGALSSNVWISFFPVGDEYISILDDGHGMSGSDLNTAMQYGSKSPLENRDSTDLGRFGLGLKTASLSQCRKLTVVSKKASVVEARQWDLDHVMGTGKWSLIALDSDEIDALPEISKLYAIEQGTLVIWQNLDRLKLGEPSFSQAMGRKMDDVHEHLALVYHRYLSGEQGLKKFSMFINGQRIQPRDPFLIGKSLQVMADEILIIHGSKVLIRPYILPHISKLSPAEIKELGDKEGLRKQQGFYIYRNKRLLVWGTWFRMMRQGDFSKLARIQVDIPNALDDLWTLDIKKSTAVPPEEVRKNLSAVIEKIAESSKRTWVFRGKKETDDRINHVWTRYRGVNGGVYYKISRDHPLVVGLTDAFPDARFSIESLLKQIECGLPLNQLFLDLNSDERIENETISSEADAIELLKGLLLTIPEKSRIDFLIRMRITEPFSAFPDLLDRMINEVKHENE